MRQITRFLGSVTVLFMASCSKTAPPQARETTPASPPALPRITQFYAAPANPHQGEKTLLCYGVENASEVRIDPPVEKLWPAMSRCFELDPVKAGTYTVTASGAGGSVTQSIRLEVGAPAVELLEVTISTTEVARGGTVAICYKAKNAKNVSVRPGAWIEPHDTEVGCAGDHPQQDTTYTVTATGAGGDSAVQRVTARVK